MNLGQIKLKLSQYKSLNPKSGDQDQFQIFLEGKTEGDNYCFLVTDFEVDGNMIYFRSEDLDEILKKVEGVTIDDA